MFAPKLHKLCIEGELLPNDWTSLKSLTHLGVTGNLQDSMPLYRACRTSSNLEFLALAKVRSGDLLPAENNPLEPITLPRLKQLILKTSWISSSTLAVIASISAPQLDTLVYFRGNFEVLGTLLRGAETRRGSLISSVVANACAAGPTSVELVCSGFSVSLRTNQSTSDSGLYVTTVSNESTSIASLVPLASKLSFDTAGLPFWSVWNWGRGLQDEEAMLQFLPNLSTITHLELRKDHTDFILYLSSPYTPDGSNQPEVTVWLLPKLAEIVIPQWSVDDDSLPEFVDSVRKMNRARHKEEPQAGWKGDAIWFHLRMSSFVWEMRCLSMESN
ncbi:hypothetical protein FRB90_007180 [Tulasnella sp. 427]|nr:hypothetical protein FRB90_007180 [Tulasnella sp. 427]